MKNLSETEIGAPHTNYSFLYDWLQSPLHETIKQMIHRKDIDHLLKSNPSFKDQLIENVQIKLKDAFFSKSDSTYYEIHSTLYQLYNLQICEPLSSEAINQHQPIFYEIRNKIEDYWLNFLNLDFIYNSELLDKKISDLIMELCWDMSLSEHPLFNFLALEATETQLFAFFNSDYELNKRWIRKFEQHL